MQKEFWDMEEWAEQTTLSTQKKPTFQYPSNHTDDIILYKLKAMVLYNFIRLSGQILFLRVKKLCSISSKF